MALNTVKLTGFDFKDFQITWNLAAGITDDDVGKPVTLDTSTSNTMKLAGEDDEIFGELLTVEDRSVQGILVGTVGLKFQSKFTVKASDTLAVGDTAVGAADGEVKKAAANDATKNYVSEVSNGLATVIKL